MNEPTHLDIFSGIGGFAIAAQAAGFRTVGFCEIEPYAQAVLKARFGAVADTEQSGLERCARKGLPTAWRASIESPRIHSDIFTLRGTDYSGVDLITGGFPCQPFSVAGKRRGAADDRAIWPQMHRVIAEARPAWVLAENVPGIINMELDRVLSDLEGEGYATGTLVVPACAVDAKHRRDRVWIVANNSSRKSREQETGNWRQGFSRASEATADCDTSGLPSARPFGEAQSANAGAGATVDGGCRWELEPDVGRVAHGIPRRVDRLKGLGNAIVPQVAFQILRHIRALIP